MKTLYELFNNPTYLFDSHCHLNDKGFDNARESIIQDMKEKNVVIAYDISINIDSSRKSLQLSKSHSSIKSFVGIDPDVFIPGTEIFMGLEINNKWFEEQFEILSDLIVQNREFIIGIGESGIDNYWINHDSNSHLSAKEKDQSLSLQRELFNMHIELAQKYELPLSIHSRKAEELCLEIIKTSALPGIFHSYTGDYETAKKILDSGWGLGINGIITFKNANDLRDIYKKIIGKENLLEKEPEFFYKKNLFFETDAPFLSPEGKRGEVNTPANIDIIFNLFRKMLSE
jgi:TatD DNase family protein